MGTLINLLNLDHPKLLSVKQEVTENVLGSFPRLYQSYFHNRAYPTFYFHTQEMELLVKNANKHYQEDVERVVAVAEQVVNRVFVFQEAWDMERSNIPVTFQGSIDWTYIPSDDPEWTYMLNRHRFFIPLGQAYLLTGDERYAKAFCELLWEWINTNSKQSTSASLTWRSIDAGIRSSNWIKAYDYFKNSPHFTTEIFEKMLLSLYEHAQFLASDFSNWQAISNWGVIENEALFELSIFLHEFRQASVWQTLSLHRLKQTAHLQIMNDGMHWEQSPMYHNEVLLCYLKTVHLSQSNGIDIDPLIIEATRKMAYADVFMAKPNHHQPMKGDSDSFDLRDIITRAAILLRDPFLKYRGYSTIDFGNLWEFGIEGMDIYHKLAAEKPQVLSMGFEDSGNYFMRSSWEKEALYLYFHCGQLGGGHGHADLFHIDVYAYGKEFLTDLGRYNYSDSSPLRRELKSAKSHNTSLVDGLDFTECIDTWGFGRIAAPLMTKWNSNELFDYVEGSHDGYLHLDDPVYTRRKIVFVKPFYWLLVDEFDCKGEHIFSQSFHFSPGEIEVNEFTKSCFTKNRNEANIHLIPINSTPFTAVLKEGNISYEYNQLDKNSSVHYEAKSTGPTALMQLIYPQRPFEKDFPTVETVEVYDLFGGQVDHKDAQAIKIHMPFLEEDHIIIICHKKPSLHRMSYCIDGTQIFGEVVLIKRKGAKEEVILIK